MATNQSLNFNIIDKNDGLYLVLTGPPPDATSLIVELGRMKINIEPALISQILRSNPFEEILIQSKVFENYRLEYQKPVIVFISPDKMMASLIVNNQTDPPLSIDDLEFELKKSGVRFGVNKDALQEALQNPGKSIIVATGVAPVDGQDSVVVMYYHEPEKKPVLMEDGRVNYYELGQIIAIHAGDIVGLRTPATSGAEGCTVLGESLPAQPGKNAIFPVGKGILVVGDKAIAEYDGALSWEKNKISVIKMITITGNIDFSVGNINFPGKVLITGNVTEGFKVHADDDIDVRGGVADAEVISRNGSIFVQKGIIGRGKAVIKAHKNVEAKFVQEAVVEAGHNIVINEYVIRCDIKAGNSVLIQGHKGKIMGNNNITAKTKIKASQIQNSSGLHLVVEGITRSQYYDRIKELNNIIHNTEKKLTTLTSQIRLLKDRTSDAASLVRLQSLLPEYLQCSDDLEACNEERNLLSNILKSTRGDGMIEIGAGLEKGMRLTIKDKSININDDLKHMSMYFDPDAKGIKMHKPQ